MAAGIAVQRLPRCRRLLAAGQLRHDVELLRRRQANGVRNRLTARQTRPGRGHKSGPRKCAATAAGIQTFKASTASVPMPAINPNCDHRLPRFHASAREQRERRGGDGTVRREDLQASAATAACCCPCKISRARLSLRRRQASSISLRDNAPALRGDRRDGGRPTSWRRPK